MRRIHSQMVFAVLLAGLMAGTIPQAAAQEKHGPSVTIAQNGPDELLNDLEYILSLTSTEEKKQWKTLKEYIEVFLVGVDRKAPVRVDVIFGDKTQRYRPSFAVPKIDEFRNDNLVPLGINTRRVAGTLYSCKGAFVGFMRFKNGYATFGEKKEDVPLNLPNPVVAVADLVKKYDLAAVATNSEEGVDERRQWIVDKRKEILAALKPKEKESADDFALRKMEVEHQLDHVEHFYAETKSLKFGWVTDAAAKNGRLDLDLAAIKGTMLHAALQLQAAKPSRFMKVEQEKGSILSLRLNGGLDDLQKKHVKETAKAIRTRVGKQIDAAKDRSAEEKTNLRKIADLIVKFTETNAEAGLLEGMMEVRANSSGKHVGLFGLRTKDGEAIVEILKLVPGAIKGQTVQLDADKEGDVRIHKLTLKIDRLAYIKEFFGEETLYVGTSKESVWMAMGEDSLKTLKSAIQATAKAGDVKPNAIFVAFAKMGPWMELRAKQAGEGKGNLELRRIAQEAFQPGDDTLSLTLERNKEDVTGKMFVEQGVLRFAGKMTAAFSKKNLDEGGKKKTAK